MLDLVFLLTIVISGTWVINASRNSTENGGLLLYEQDIQEKILTDYNSDVRPPSREAQNLVTVEFQVKINKLNYLDIKKQTMSLNAFTMLEWDDARLKWNASEYGNISETVISSSSLWTPGIVLFNEEDDANYDLYNTDRDIYRSKIHVTNTGTARWIAPVTWVSSCDVDATWFPFDQQVCNITYGSRSYHSKQLKLEFYDSPNDLKSFKSERFQIDSGEWKITNVLTHSENVQFSCCPDSFSTITYSITLKRHPIFYIVYVLLPLASQIFLFAFMFFIPPNGERLSFGITILLNITMYILLISEKLPETSKTHPMLGMIFVTMFYLLSSGLCLSIISTFLSERETDLPAWLEWFCYRKRQYKGNNVNVRTPSVNSNLELNQTHDLELTRLKVGSNKTNPIDEDCVFDPIPNSKYDTKQKKPRKETTWKSFTETCNYYLFAFYLLLIVIIPVIICLSLDNKGLANY